MRRAALLVLVAALVVGGVAGAGATTRHPVPTAGISLATPSSWREIDSKAVLASAPVQKLLKENPQLASIINQVASPSSPVKFLAFDPHVSEGFATNVNVVVSAVPANTTLAVFAAAIAPQLRTLPGLTGKISTSTVKLPIASASRSSFQLTVVTNGKKLVVQTLQYAFVRHALGIVVTFSTTPGQSARRAATFKAIAASLHAP